VNKLKIDLCTAHNASKKRTADRNPGTCYKETLPFRLEDTTNVRNKMISDLKTPGNFVTPYGLATESPESKLYGAYSYWQGPVWAPPMLIIINGLSSIGEAEFAKQLAEKFCNTCKKSGFARNFDALTGRPLRDPAYTWISSTFLILAHDYQIRFGTLCHIEVEKI